MFKRSEFRGNFYWFRCTACRFFALATKSVNFCLPHDFSCFVLLVTQKNVKNINVNTKRKRKLKVNDINNNISII